MSNVEVLRADLVVEANTGQARRGLEELRREFQQTTGAMSTEALKAAVAQEKLDKAIARHGAQSTQAKSAEIAYRRELEATTRATTQHAVATDHADRELGQFTRGAISGSGVLRGLGRSVAFASAAYLGSAGLVFGIRESVRQAVEQDAVLANLREALEAGGHSWDQYGAKIEEATGKLKLQSAFDDEELYKSLQLLVRGTGSVNRALTLNALAADVARGRHMGLVQAANLLIRAQAGQVGSLRRLGINVDKGISGFKALQQVQQQYAGAAQAYSNSAAGAQDMFTVAIQDTEKAIGRGLLPVVVEINQAIVPWLANTENQQKIQEKVNEVVTDGAKIVKGMADAIEAVAPAVHIAVDALGGLENAAKTALIVGIALKAGQAAASFGLITAASATTRTAVVADAAAEVAALNTVAAAEARVAGAAGAGAIPAGRGGLPIAAGAGATAIIAALVYKPQGDAFLKKHHLGFATESGIDIVKNLFGGGGSEPDKLDRSQVGRIFTAITAGQVTSDFIDKYLKPYLEDSDYQALKRHADEVAKSGNTPAGFSGGGTAGRPGALPFTAQQQRQQNLAAASLNPYSASAASAYRAQIDYDKNALAFLEQRRQAGKISNAEYVAKYRTIQSDLASMQGQLDAIAQKAASDAQQAAAEAAAAAKKAEEARRKQAEAVGLQVRRALQIGGIGPALGVKGDLVIRAGVAGSSDEFKAATTVSDALRSAAVGQTRLGVSAQQLRQINADQAKKDSDLRDQILQNRLAYARLAETRAGDNAKKIKAAKRQELAAYQAILDEERRAAKGLTGLAKAKNISEQIATKQAIASLQNDLRGQKTTDATRGANESQFLQSFQGIVAAYAPNAVPVGAGQAGTRLTELVHETRRTNKHLEKIVVGGRYPASKYRQLENDAAYG